MNCLSLHKSLLLFVNYEVLLQWSCYVYRQIFSPTGREEEVGWPRETRLVRWAFGEVHHLIQRSLVDLIAMLVAYTAGVVRVLLDVNSY